MDRRGLARLADIKEYIGHIRSLLEGKSFDDMYADVAMRAAFERFLEIVSEAARHLPEEWKRQRPEVPWRNIADLGNQIRHAYRRLNARTLWAIYIEDLEALETSVDVMIAAHGPLPRDTTES